MYHIVYILLYILCSCIYYFGQKQSELLVGREDIEKLSPTYKTAPVQKIENIDNKQTYCESKYSMIMTPEFISGVF